MNCGIIIRQSTIQLCQGHDFVATTAYMLPILFKTEFNEDLALRT